MRGQRSFLSRTKADLVLLAVRYQAGETRIALARGIERRGVVWSDWKLYDRQAVLEQLRAGRRVFTGRAADLAGDLELLAPVRLVEVSGSDPVLSVDGPTAAADALELPRF